MPVQFTTDLPDEDQPALGNGVEDEVAIDRESATTNNGETRLQIRETGAQSWAPSATGFAEQTVAFGTLTTQFTGREDGEEYEVRARSETQDVTGEWTAPVSIVTKFPGAVNLTATAIDETTVELTWTDQDDNEIGQEVIRERLGPDGDWWPQRVVADAGANTEAFVDDTAQPDEEFRYRIRAFTDDTAATSDTDTAATSGIGLSRRRIPASGWYVEIETDAGEVLRPSSILDSSRPDPRVNDVPRVRVDVPAADRWRRPEIERATMRVWKDGDRLPIDRVDEVEQSPETVKLVGRGGTALDEVVSYDVDELTDTDDFIRTILSDAGIPHDVDDPASDVRDDVSVLTAPGISELVDAFTNVDGTTGNTIPIQANADAGALEVQQTVWTRSARFASTINAPIDDADPPSGTYWQDRAFRLESPGDRIAWTFESTWKWDAADLAAYIRAHTPTGEHPEFEVRVDGTTVDVFFENAIPSASDPSWIDFPPNGPQFDGVTIEGLTTVEIEVTSSGSGALLVDGGGLDSQFESVGWGSSVDSDGNISGPPRYPSAVDLVTKDVGTIEQVVGGSLDVELNYTVNGQALAVSNDGGDSYQTASNTESLTAPFASGSTQLRARVTLSRYDDGGENPLTGNAGQSISNLSLAASVDDTPFIESEAFEDTIANLLMTFAERQRFIWEQQPSPPGGDVDAPGTVVVSQVGHREATTDEAVSDFTVATDVSELVETVIVYGPSRQVRDNRVVLSGLSYVGVGDGYLKPGSVRVYQPVSDGADTVYEEGSDYTVLPNEGAIRRVSGSAIADGEEVALDYETKRRSEYTVPDADGTGDTIRETATNAVTQQALDQAALFAAKELSDPQYEAEVELVTTDIGFNLVDALGTVDVPTDQTLEVKDVTVNDTSITVTLGAGETTRGVFQSINRRFSGLAERL
ncbi:fibronectin type III domain-containing protein [Halorubrum sp. RMP-47]|uniref:Fibronectin type III domain-containing protein n=1 Tax=Halorubrum miltondacostae TaxID=3076378 RepID=A0ABD5LZ28_9EURY